MLLNGLKLLLASFCISNYESTSVLLRWASMRRVLPVIRCCWGRWLEAIRLTEPLLLVTNHLSRLMILEKWRRFVTCSASYRIYLLLRSRRLNLSRRVLLRLLIKNLLLVLLLFYFNYFVCMSLLWLLLHLLSVYRLVLVLYLFIERILNWRLGERLYRSPGPRIILNMVLLMEDHHGRRVVLCPGCHDFLPRAAKTDILFNDVVLLIQILPVGSRSVSDIVDLGIKSSRLNRLVAT